MQEPQPFQALYEDALRQVKRLEEFIKEVETNYAIIPTERVGRMASHARNLENFLGCAGVSDEVKKEPQFDAYYLEQKCWKGDKEYNRLKNALEENLLKSIPSDDEYIKMNKEAVEALGSWAGARVIEPEDNQGWIEWKSGSQFPVMAGKTMELKCTNGAIFEITCKENDFKFLEVSLPHTITHYRIKPNTVKPEKKTLYQYVCELEDAGTLTVEAMDPRNILGLISEYFEYLGANNVR